MRNNETGEYELVVGNKQLLSGFFIVVLLCAVAFAMGYVVGENSHSTKAVETASTAKPVDNRPDGAPAPAIPPPDSRAATPTEAAAPPPDPVADPKGAAAESPLQPTTRPARDTQPEPEPPRRKEKEPPPPAHEPKAAPTAPGSYWQVAATNNHDSAETLLQTLKQKGFPAVLGPGPNNLTRVLVGPYSDTAALGRAKTELEAAGFSHMVRK